MTVKEFRSNVSFLLEQYENFYKNRNKEAISFKGLCEIVKILFDSKSEKYKDLLKTIDIMFEFRNLFFSKKGCEREFYYIRRGEAFLFLLKEKRNIYTFFKRILYYFLSKKNAHMNNIHVEIRIDFMKYIISLPDNKIKEKIHLYE